MLQNLNRWANQVRFEAQANTRVDDDKLRPSINYKAKKFNEITFVQNKYGKYITPKNVKFDRKDKNYPSPPFNALRIEIDKGKPELIKDIMKDIKSLLLSPIITKR
jgi:hypothetical protein